MLFSNRMVRYISVILAVVALAVPSFAVKNVIIMIGDGMGPEHVKLGSYYASGAAGRLSFEPYYKCSVRTSSLGGAVTDSAAAATALATGNKVSNGVLSQSTTGSPYKTVLETAKDLGKRTGLVTTVPISDATPAGFGAHEADRNNSGGIIGDYLGSSKPNVLFGGGSSYWNSTQLTTAQQGGYQTVNNYSQMAGLNTATTQYALGLFASGDMTYESDRVAGNTQPHLTQMANTALSILSQDQDGFFLMVEGGLIDHASHSGLTNQAAGEVAEFNNAVQSVLNWMQGRSDTMLIVTADHETGGLCNVVNKGAGVYPTASWSGGGNHTGANVPFYVTGSGSDLVDQYISGGSIENTDVYKVMNTALTTQDVPEPSTLLILGPAGCGLLGLLRRKRF